MAMFFRGQKGTPVKYEFDIFLEDIKPWTSAHAQSVATIPVLLSWRRGSKRSGSTKSVLPTVGGPDGGRVVFNEGFKLPATLFEKKPGQFQKKCVAFALLEDESAKAIKISRQLATGQLDLSEYENLVEPCSVNIPLSTGLGGTHAEGEPTLFVRITCSGRLASPSSIFSSGRLSSGGREVGPQRSSYLLPESDDSGDNETTEIDSFTDDEDSPRSSDDESKNASTKSVSNRQKLFSPTPSNACKPLSPNPVIARERASSLTSRTFVAEHCGSSNNAENGVESTKNKVENSKISEEDKRKKLLGLTLSVPPGKALGTASKSFGAAAASAGKTVEATRVSAEKKVEAVRMSAGRNLEVAELSAGKTAEEAAASAASAAKSVEVAAVSLGKSVSAAAAAAVASASVGIPAAIASAGLGLSPAAAAAAAYSAKWAARRKDGQSSESSPSDFALESISLATADSARKLDLPGSWPSSDPVATGSPSTPESAIGVREARALTEKKVLGAGDEYDGGRSVLEEARAKMAMVEKRAIEELRSKVAAAEAKAVANQEKGKEVARGLNQKLSKREDELRDTAAIEVALYSVPAEHTSSAHKVHTPARRLGRLYIYAFKNWSPERRASSARNSVQGLVVVVRACGNDVPRLTYWWSNIVVLREAIMQACNVDTATSGIDQDVAPTSGNDTSFTARATRSQQLRRRYSRQGSGSELLGLKALNNDWRECSNYVIALLKVESWIHGRILECVWWQAMAPPMQVGHGDAKVRTGLGETFINVREELNRLAGRVKDGLGELNKFAGDVKEFFTKEKQDGNLSQLGDARQGVISIEIWKNAFTDALKRLCPLQGHEAECGCLPVLSRQVIAECVDRLDVAMFNGIMRNPDENSPTDPLADPITDLSVLPIPVGALTFGAGSQLKNAVVTWSTWLSTLLSVKDPNSGDSSNKDGMEEQSESAEGAISPKKFRLLKATGDLLMLPKDMIDMAMRREAARKEAEKGSPYFVLLRAAGDLLMLPKDMLMDKSVRNEVCPQLKLPLIRRILCNFVPDEFAPEPISPSLVAAINTEVSLERQMHGEAEMTIEDISVAPVPPVVYIPPSSTFVRLWIGEPPGAEEWGKTPSSLLRKGYGSDDELNQFQTPLAWLKESPNTRNRSLPLDKNSVEEDSGAEAGVYIGRYQLLKEVWNAPERQNLLSLQRES